MNNGTFPHSSGKVLDYYENLHASKTTEIKPEKINGNYSDYEDVYEKRQNHLKREDKENKQTNKFLSLNLPYNNQILDYIRKKKLNKNKKRK